MNIADGPRICENTHVIKRIFGFLFKQPEAPVADDRWTLPPEISKVTAPKQKNALAGKLRVPLKGSGSLSFDIVGEANYQPALERISGRKTYEGKAFKCTAVISLESTNLNDPNAVKVEISGEILGYFSRLDAKDYASQIRFIGKDKDRVEVAAMSVGGFKNKAREGHYGVKLDITRHA